MKHGKKISSNICFDCRDDYSEVEEIGGYLDCNGSDTTASFPKVTTIGGTLDCRGSDTTASFPKVTTIGGSLYCNGSDTTTSFPKLTTIGGSLFCSGAGTTASFPKLTIIGGSLYCNGSDTTASFPKVTIIGGSLFCSGAGTTASFPKLTIIGGYLDCNGSDTTASFPKVTTIGGSLFCSGAGTTASFPKLTTIGGYLYCNGADITASFPKLTKQKVGNQKATKEVRIAFIKKGFAFFDNILSTIVSVRNNKNGTHVYKLQIVGKSEISYGIEIDGVFSHGDTLKQAKESMLFKISDRDTSAYEDWTLDTLITKKQAIQSYRIITGACEAGTRDFVDSVDKAKARYTVLEIVELTKGRFGNDEYLNFFKDKQQIQ